MCSFPNFSPSCFDISSWNFAYDFVLLYYRTSSSVVNFHQFLLELCPFWNLEYWKYTIFRTLFLHALTYWAEILYLTLFYCTTDQVPVLSISVNGVFISQLIRYARACSSYECFILRARRLSSKLLKQGYLVERLKSSFRKFYGRYGDLIQQYEVSLSRMLDDILSIDQQRLPNQSDFPPISWPWYRLWHSPNYEWFPWSICNGCGMPAGNAYPSGHLVPSPILGLANAPIVETKFLEHAMSLLDFSPRILLGTFSILLCRSYAPFGT